jgi:hypothetical protein
MKWEVETEEVELNLDDDDLGQAEIGLGTFLPAVS